MLLLFYMWSQVYVKEKKKLEFVFQKRKFKMP